jgi:hypothetical protein
MTGKSCPWTNETPARSRPRPTPSCPRRGYTGVLDRLLAGLGPSRPLAEVSGRS